MTFRLKKSTGSNHAATKFDVIDGAGTICGRISLPPEEARDLLAHWQDAPRSHTPAPAAAGSRQGAGSAMLAAANRGSPAPATARSKERNPAVSAMLRAARHNRLTKQAILRVC
jgi:hypothetical protein